MDRNRSRGSQTSVTLTPGMSCKRKQACNMNPGWSYREVNETPGSRSGQLDTRETMADHVCEYYRYNPVAHVRRIPYAIPGGMQLASIVKPLPAWYTPGVWFTYGWDAGRLRGNSVSFQGFRASTPGDITAPSWGSIDWSNLVSTVGQQLDGQMLVGQNLLVDLFTISQTIGMVKNPFQLFKKLPRRLEGKPLSKVHQRIAGSYLEYKFGWENLYRSVAALAAVWSEARRHQAYLKETAGRYIPLSASAVSEYAGSTLYQPVSIGDALRGGVLTLSCTRARQTARFSLVVKRSVAASFLTRGELVMSRLGLNKRNVAEALWDVVPYSFVVDWFTHLNRVFKQPPISWSGRELRQVGSSFKREWFGKVTVRSQAYTDLSGYTPATVVDLGEQVVQKSYTRVDGFPSGTTSVGLFGNLNKTQLAEGIALIVQRL